MDLIYCAGGSQPKCCVAVALGFLYGIRYDYVACSRHPVDFIDTHWEQYDFDRMRAEVERHRPGYVVVPDVLDTNDLTRALEQAEALAEFSDRVIIVPKVDVVDDIPDKYVLGYSVPTNYGGTTIPVERFRGRKVHLLGGTPLQQARIWRELRDEVISVDGNAHQVAARYGDYWDGRAMGWRRNPYDGPGHYMHSFTLSLLNIVEFWHREKQGQRTLAELWGE